MISIGNRKIGDDEPVFIIAELSANHGQNFDQACDTIRAMADSGADAVKLQTYTPDTITLDVDNEYFQIKEGTLWDGQTLHSLYGDAYTPWDWHADLKKLAESLGLIWFSSPFDLSAVDFLEELNTPAYKIASFEIQDIPLIEYVASKGKPVIISTGIAELADIEMALKACQNKGNRDVALLKCTSAYPAPFSEINLRTIPNMLETFSVTVGISDHTPGMETAVAAVALGARIVEKHFILDRGLGGPDSAFSMEPAEFRAMVHAIRNVESALGCVSYQRTETADRMKKFGRSLFAAQDIPAGAELNLQNVRSVRPASGLAPVHLKEIIGRTAARSIQKGTPLTWNMIT